MVAKIDNANADKNHNSIIDWFKNVGDLLVMPNAESVGIVRATPVRLIFQCMLSGRRPPNARRVLSLQAVVRKHTCIHTHHGERLWLGPRDRAPQDI